jgi:putative two-component system response regulator
MLRKNYEILLIDDKKENLELLDSFLVGNGYKIRSALNAEMAFMSIEAKIPDLILLDIEMPNISGYEVCEKLKANPKTEIIPIIFISAHNETESKIKAFKVGGVDYITKPFANEEVVARVKMHLKLAEYQHLLEEKVEKGLKEIKLLNEELELTQKEMIITLGTIMETRDDDTGKHVIRVAKYSELLARLYGLDDEVVDLIYKASPFHDAGKVAIPDNILNKPGKFESYEWEIMKTHALKGYDIFKDSKKPILKMAAIIAKEHHEYWDGSGYPNGLKGYEINIAGRIVILADVLDALTNKRVYKETWTFDESVKFIQEQKGKMFEPRIVELFIKHIEEFKSIYKSLKESA